MNITVDTESNYISVNGPFTIEELIHALEYFHPDFEWRKLESTGSIYLQMPTPPLLATDGATEASGSAATPYTKAANSHKKLKNRKPLLP